MTDQASNTHNPMPADQPLALRLSEELGPNARKLASQLQNAAYNCGYEDADPANATTRQAKADERCRKVLAALYEEIERLQAAESVAMVRALKLEAARRELAKVNNEFGSETADWPDAWRHSRPARQRDAARCAYSGGARLDRAVRAQRPPCPCLGAAGARGFGA